MSVDISEYGKNIVNKYAKQLGYDDDKLEMLHAIVESITEILHKHNVFAKSVEWDREGAKLINNKVQLPSGMEEVITEIIRDNEFYKIFLKEEFGGMGYTPIVLGPILEVLSTFDLSLQILVTISLSVLEPLISHHKAEFNDVIQKFADGKTTGYVAFTEAGAGSNLERVKSTSMLEGDEWVLNGTKIFISNGGYADTGLFLAQNIVGGKPEGTNVFLVEGLKNIEILRLEEKSGLHANPTAQLHFKDVRVPKENLIGKVGEGYSKVLERLMGMRLGVAYQASSMAKRGYQLAVEYAQTREQFGRPIISFPEIKNKIKSMELQIPRLDDYAIRSAFAVERNMRGWIPIEVGAGGKNMAEKMAAKMLPGVVRYGIAHYFVSSAKLYCTEIANSMLYDAQQIFGGMGFVAETEINKIARDARVLSIYEGTSEIHSWAINRAIKAVNMIPKFKYPYLQYDSETIYEKMLFARFNQLKDII
ncbi:MAG: acyl-CoA/acyl-ACP dehydrogenase [Candidatus Heimdallarchaeota archaeon]|nr:acyl-CoA/acyl-ACP dehydrogenase [Candidatus Heimdallarchaeota archaeon]MDH5647849.1 acyl-CoA/acyl-ACP dehydrogenase [Candidatus Heimdallarchaeota archaeon]